MRTIAGHMILVVSLILCSFSKIPAQRNLSKTDTLTLAGIRFQDVSLQADSRKKIMGDALRILEYESGYYSILKTEVFKWRDFSENGSDRREWVDILIKKLKEAGWQVQKREWDTAYYKLEKKEEKMVMYISANKKSGGLYFGKADSTYKDDENEWMIVGLWGNISMDQRENYNVYLYKGKQIRPQYSRIRTFGIQFNHDGTYLKGESSGRNEYGDYQIIGQHIVLFKKGPINNRSFMNNMPEKYRWFIRRNNETGKSCLFLEPSEKQQILGMPERIVIGYCK